VGLLLAAAGCSSASPTTGKQPAAVRGSHPPVVTATDAFRFTPARITAPSGDVTIRLVGTGSYPHNIAVPALHRTSATVGTAPGQQASTLLRLTGVRPGTYRFICTFHNKAGMTGELVVT
jgi:plastocyanin